MKYDVFISYSRKDYVNDKFQIIPNNVISKIKSELTKHGFTYWFDEDGIYSGDAFVNVITEAIRDSEVFLFISSKSSNESEWTNHEIATAKLLKKKTIPFRIDDSIYNSSILMYLAPLDYIDYSKSRQKAFQQLVSSLENHFSKQEERDYTQRKKDDNQREKDIIVLPKGIDKWNWAAFLIATIWVLFNTIEWKSIRKHQIGLIIGAILSFLLGPLGQILFGLYMGRKGNEFAWNTNKWSSVEDYNKIQKFWLIIAIIVTILIIIINLIIRFF